MPAHHQQHVRHAKQVSIQSMVSVFHVQVKDVQMIAIHQTDNVHHVKQDII